MYAHRRLRFPPCADTPNPLSPAQEEAYRIFQKDQTDYKVRVKAQVEQYATDMHIGGS